MRVLVLRFWQDDSGQSLVEYALLLTVVTVGTVALMNESGKSVPRVWTTANARLQVTPPSPSAGRKRRPPLRFKRFWSDECGQNMTEWALLVALVGLGSAALMNNSGSSMSTVWNTANLALQGQAQTSGSSPSSPGSGGGTSGNTGGSSGGSTGSSSGGSGSSGSSGGSSGGSGSGSRHHTGDHSHSGRLH